MNFINEDPGSRYLEKSIGFMRWRFEGWGCVC